MPVDLINTQEMYLKTILELEEEGVAPIRARIAERLDHSGPTVSQTVARMIEADLLVLANDRRLRFTKVGERRAVQVMRKHRLAELLLSRVVGLDWALLHDEACRWEHVMSDTVADHLASLFKNLSTSPYGTAIPAPAATVADLQSHTSIGVEPLSRFLERHPGPSEVTLVRLGEVIQTDPQGLSRFLGLGLTPGRTIWAQQDPDGSVRLHGDDRIEPLLLTTAESRHITITQQDTDRGHSERTTLMNTQPRALPGFETPRTEDGIEDFKHGVESLAHFLLTDPFTRQTALIGEVVADAQRNLAEALTRSIATQRQAEALADDAVAVLWGAAKWAAQSGRDSTCDRMVTYLCSRADALSILLEDEEMESLIAYTQSPREASLAEKRLAQKVSAVKEQHDFVQGALQRLEQMVEADSCFR